ncbi:hypothetical protein N0V88_005108 [Collariella sp. IMI 366227]|nr:hypothetical protein N0V88_005108 [Collariella sp. IMI 366227]
MTKLKFKEGNHRNAPRIPKKRWDEMKSLILELYVTQNKSKQVVCDIMEQEHGFCATVTSPAALTQKEAPLRRTIWTPAVS